MHHDFPSGLEYLCRLTGDRLGPVREIALTRTLLSFYEPFMSKERLGAVVTSMRGQSVPHLKYRMGLLTSGFRADHPLRACPVCIQADLTAHGWAYWHLVHQLPGVSHCTVHCCPLVQFRFAGAVAARSPCLYLPNSAVARPSPCAPAEDQLLEFSNFVISLLGSSRARQALPLRAARQLTKARLRDMGLCTEGGGLRVRQLEGSFLLTCDRLRSGYDFASLPRSAREAANLLCGMLRARSTDKHPLKILLLLYWAFGSAAGVENAVAALSAPSSALSLPPPTNVDDLHESIVSSMRTGTCASAAARSHSVSFSKAKTLALANGISVSGRPKRVHGLFKQHVTSDLAEGMDRSTAAAKYALSLASIDRLLAWEKGLHERWSAARRGKTQMRMRQEWHAALALEVGRARKLAPAAYAWLYRHDREWLLQSKSGEKVKKVTARRIDWCQRDLALSALVALTVGSQETTSPTRLWELCELVPPLKAKLSALARLPATRAAIDAALNLRSP